MNYANKKFEHPSLTPAQCAQLETFAGLIQRENKIHNLTAVAETERIYTRHFNDSLAALQILDAGWADNPAPALIDIGSGAGLPALVLAIALPHWNITSVEATGKKANFQKKVIDELQLNNAAVIQARAEELAHDQMYREQFDAVTARAVSPLNILAELCIPLVKPGGKFMAWKGPDITAELDQANKALNILGAQVEQIIPYSEIAPEIENNFSLVVMIKTRTVPFGYPRQFQKIKKSPL